MMHKQDRQGVRTAADLERKYDLDALVKRVVEIDAVIASLSAATEKLCARIDKLHPPYSVTTSLTNCVIDNTAATVNAGGAYAATVEAVPSYAIVDYSVTMGGEDITEAACTSADGEHVKIYVEAVTGDIEIMAAAFMA